MKKMMIKGFLALALLSRLLWPVSSQSFICSDCGIS